MRLENEISLCFQYEDLPDLLEIHFSIVLTIIAETVFKQINSGKRTNENGTSPDKIKVNLSILV